MDAAAWYSALLVGQTLSGGVYLGDLLTNGEVPAWREETFSCLEQAREQAAFAPYLPETDIPGYGEFYAALSYQEGVRNRLTVRWSRGYDDVSVTVSLPEGTPTYHLADVNRPEDLTLTEAQEGNDFYAYQGESWHSAVLRPGAFLVVFPGDAHRIKVQVDGPRTVSKAVFKVCIAP